MGKRKQGNTDYGEDRGWERKRPHITKKTEGGEGKKGRQVTEKTGGWDNM